MNTRFLKLMKGFGLLLAASMLVAACQPAASSAPVSATLPAATPTSSGVTPAVKVSDQAVAKSQVVVAEVDSSGPGWIVIHAQAKGQPGPVVGYTAVTNGANMNVMVTIDLTKATPVLYAMLHVDVGKVGTYEFPGADVPAMLNGQGISPAFNVTGLSTPTSASSSSSSSTLGGSGGNDTGYGPGSDSTSTQKPAASGSSTVMVSSNATLGKFLVDSKGMTLYIFTKDTAGVSNCSGGCLKVWPALIFSGTGAPTADSGVTGKLGLITRSDGSKQVTYNDQPLYYYAGDAQPGDTTGQNVGGVWFVIAP